MTNREAVSSTFTQLQVRCSPIPFQETFTLPTSTEELTCPLPVSFSIFFRGPLELVIVLLVFSVKLYQLFVGDPLELVKPTAKTGYIKKRPPQIVLVDLPGNPGLQARRWHKDVQLKEGLQLAGRAKTRWRPVKRGLDVVEKRGLHKKTATILTGLLKIAQSL